MKKQTKTPSRQEKIEVYEKFLLNINQCINGHDLEGLKVLIQNADTWAHIKTYKKEKKREIGLTKREKQKVLNQAFWKLVPKLSRNM